MLRKVTKAEIVDIIASLDKRTDSFVDADYNYVMDMGYAELATVTQAFYNEEVVSMAPYYDAGESKITLDVQEDVLYVYETYLTIENQTNVFRFPHGIAKITDENAIYKDGRAVGRIHVDLDKVNIDRFGESVSNNRADNAVIKYAYTPTSTSEDIYIDQGTLLALRDAFGAALFNKLNDVEKESQKRASLNRTAAAITPRYPNDFSIAPDSDVATEGRVYIRSIFTAGA